MVLKKPKQNNQLGVIEKEWFGLQIAHFAYLTLTEWLLGVMCPTVRKAVSSLKVKHELCFCLKNPTQLIIKYRTNELTELILYFIFVLLDTHN